MDAELSLIMANQALVKSDSFVLDPFVGTGSFLITCSHYGAFTLGSDIDGQQIRGKGMNLQLMHEQFPLIWNLDGASIESNVEQYNLANRIMGNVVCDFGMHALTLWLVYTTNES